MSRRHLHSALLGLALCTLLVGVPRGATADTLDGLIADAAKNPQTFNRGVSLTFLYLAQESLDKNMALGADAAVMATIAAAERSKPDVNQQNGAPSTAAGTTTLTEKTGLAALLNLAIERGAISQTNSGSSYTLQTTPYLVFSKLGSKDDEATWDRYGWSSRIGISATFAQNGSDSSMTGSDFESGEIKFAAIADGNARDKKIRDVIMPGLKAEVQPLLNRVTLGIQDWIAKHSGVDRAQTNFLQWLQNGLPKTEKEIRDELAKDFGGLLTKDDVQSLAGLVADIDAEQKVRTSAIQEALEKVKALAPKANQLSFSYGYQRDTTTSDFSLFKVLYSYKNTKNASKLSFNLNGEWDVNNMSATSTGTALSRPRAYSAEASLTAGKFANDSCDLTAAGKWMRPMGETRDMVFAQAKLNLYLARGVTIPVAITYANRTEESDHRSLRFNAGLVINGDTFLGIARTFSP